MAHQVADTSDRLTPWFDIDMHLPAHAGVFEVKVAAAAGSGVLARQGYCHWDGQRFGGVAPTADEALALRSSSPEGKVKSFRGVEVGLLWIPRPAPEVNVDESKRRTLELLNRIESKFARYDEAACGEMLFRFESAARSGKLLSYSQFARGIKFSLPDEERRKLKKFTIDSNAISSGDKEILLDFACYLGAATYRDSKVLINALLTMTRANPAAPKRFFSWARRIGQYAGTEPVDAEAFWKQAVRAVHARYA